jgi:hypothetical protein
MLKEEPDKGAVLRPSRRVLRSTFPRQEDTKPLLFPDLLQR